MERQSESTERPVSASLKATYRALLARGLEAGEAANLTAFLHGLPSAGVKWSLTEVEAIIQRRRARRCVVTTSAQLRLRPPPRVSRNVFATRST